MASASTADAREPARLENAPMLVRDREPARRLADRIERRKRAGRPHDKLSARLDALLQRSADAVRARAAYVPRITYPEALPIAAQRDTIARAIDAHQVVVVAGETGSGKTTQLPKICLEAARGLGGMIGHTQPRRLAARNVAARLAAELDTDLGGAVGWQTRFGQALSERTLVKLMTDGILLAETQHDPDLMRYDTLIVDEAHERSLNIDFLLGYLKRLVGRRPELKVVVTSATIDVERFAAHFDEAAVHQAVAHRPERDTRSGPPPADGQASVSASAEGRTPEGRTPEGRTPVLSVSGRIYPVEVRYRPLRDDSQTDAGSDTELSIESRIVAVLDEIRALERSGQPPPSSVRDVLIFLPGEREIRDAHRALRESADERFEILPLYARLSAADQRRVFEPGPRRRIVLATNVAETSLTVPRIGYVIDPGLARISRYSYRSKLQRLPIEPISQASAEQRAGRCGRLAPGVCFRLYDESDFLARPAFTDPEILRTGLASVVLQMKTLGLGEPERFPFMEPPDARALADGRRLLEELTALTPDGALTDQGRRMARLPVDPRLACVLLAAHRHGSLSEALVIVAALAIQDPRERPADKRPAADEAHAAFADPRSDFLDYLHLWHWFETQRDDLGSTALRRSVQRHFLSWMRLREWRALHRQLHLACREMALTENAQPARYEAVHRALVAGFLSLLGVQTDTREYLGARGRKFLIFPGSNLFRRRPKWVVAAEVVETSRVYARTVAEVDARWVEAEAPHLVKRQYSEPHWHRRRGQVMAFERVTLFGLPLVEGRRVGYAQSDPALAREIFIRRALVDGEIDTRGDFLAHNRALLEEIRAMEARIRRRDLLVDEDDLFALYAERIPDNICSARGFERWRRQAEARDPEILHFAREALLRRRPGDVREADYPGELELVAGTFRVRYTFAPGTEADGTTLYVPRAALGALRAEALEWVVPGMLEEKCTALLRALPKRTRKALTPIPDHVAAIRSELMAPECYRQGSLLSALATAVKRHSGITIPPDAWRPESLPPHLVMRVAVVDENGQERAAGRDLMALQRAHAQAGLDAPAASAGLPVEGLSEWNFGALPERMMDDDGVAIWPALVDEGATVAMRAAPDPETAARWTRNGVHRLALLVERPRVRALARDLPDAERLKLLYAPLGTTDGLVDQLARVGARRAFPVEAALPRDREMFAALIERGRSCLVEYVYEAAHTALTILEHWHAVRLALGSTNSPAFQEAVDDERAHLARLLPSDFLVATPLEWLDAMPRYLEAARRRLEQLQGNVVRDREAIAELAAWRHRLSALEAMAGPAPPEALERLPWLLEEYRVSLFAQKLGTRGPISGKRLDKRFTEAEQALRPGRR